MNLGRFGVLTVDRARDLAKLKLAEVIVGDDTADKVRQVRKGMTVSEMCSWYLEEARAGNILGRKNVPIQTSYLVLVESRIRTGRTCVGYGKRCNTRVDLGGRKIIKKK